MITHPNVTKTSIRRHYDLLSPFYRLLWGQHIHHGLWDEADEHFELDPKLAQIRLTEALADAADIGVKDRVLDVGCGLGGSSIHLARTRDCHVTGVTISPVQRLWATIAGSKNRVSDRVRFLRGDAERVVFDPESFDVIWSVECTEHLFDKATFFRHAAGWLRPHGRMAICAWVAGNEPLSEAQRLIAEQVCEGMFCPSLGTAGEYDSWMSDAGLEDVVTRDWTSRVAQTWTICLERVRKSGTGRLAPVFGRDATLFLSRFETMIEAYQSGAMRYVAFTATKPGTVRPSESVAERMSS